MTRLKAFLIHFGISAAIYIALLYLVIFVWYPQPFFAADGGWQGIRIITGVDIVLGPVLTLIVFRPGKRGLKLDLGIIAALQLVALSWGTWIVHSQRPALIVYADSAFYSLSSPETVLAGEGAKQFLQHATSSPAYAFVRLPKNKKTRIRFETRAAFSGRLLYMLGNRYEPLTQSNMQIVFKHAIKPEEMIRWAPKNAKLLDAFLKDHGKKAADFAFIPLQCRYKDVILALQRPDGRIAGTLDIDSSPFFF